LRHGRLGRNAKGGHPPEPSAFALEKSARLHTGVARKEGENLGRHFLDGLVATHRFRQSDLPSPKPILSRASARAPADQQEDDDGEGGTQQGGQYAADHGGSIGRLHLCEILLSQPQLLGRHRRKPISDPVHLDLAAVGLDDRQSGGRAF